MPVSLGAIWKELHIQSVNLFDVIKPNFLFPPVYLILKFASTHENLEKQRSFLKLQPVA